MQAPEKIDQNADIEFVTFVAGQQNFCLEITQIREIRRWTQVTMLPYTPDYVLGVINLRGAVIPIIDLAAKLALDRIEPSAAHVIIIVATDNRTVGLLVDAVSEIISINSATISETPQGQDGAVNKIIDGIITIDDAMTKIINLGNLLPPDTQVAA